MNLTYERDTPTTTRTTMTTLDSFIKLLIYKLPESRFTAVAVRPSRKSVKLGTMRREKDREARRNKKGEIREKKKERGAKK